MIINFAIIMSLSVLSTVSFKMITRVVKYERNCTRRVLVSTFTRACSFPRSRCLVDRHSRGRETSDRARVTSTRLVSSLLQADVYKFFTEITGTDSSLINMNHFGTAAKHVFDKLQTASKNDGVFSNVEKFPTS